MAKKDKVNSKKIDDRFNSSLPYPNGWPFPIAFLYALEAEAGEVLGNWLRANAPQEVYDLFDNLENAYVYNSISDDEHLEPISPLKRIQAADLTETAQELTWGIWNLGGTFSGGGSSSYPKGERI